MLNNSNKRIKFLILTVFILSGLVLSFNKASSQNMGYKQFKPFKLAFIPDIHISFDKKDDWILYNESLVLLQDTIKSLNKRSDINFTLFGGDLIDNKDKKLSDLPMLLDSLNEIKMPYYAILGDREADLDETYTKNDFCVEFRRYGFADKTKTYWALEPVPDVLLIGLDSSQSNRFSGQISQEQLIWLDETLGQNRDKFTIIAVHHPVLPTTEQDKAQPWQNFILTNSDELLSVLNKYPQVKLVLSGHHHLNNVQNANNAIYMAAPSIVTYPNEFKVITVYPDKIETENIPISYKQITKKSKKLIQESEYASQFDSTKPKKILDFQKGNEYSRNKVFYFLNQR